jgi:hypothetical protein
MKKSLIEPVDDNHGQRLTPQLELCAGVASKALALGKSVGAERLMSSVTADFMNFAQAASSYDDVEAVARMHAILSGILPKLEAATGKPWARCLKEVTVRPWTPRPRGQA